MKDTLERNIVPKPLKPPNTLPYGQSLICKAAIGT